MNNISKSASGDLCLRKRQEKISKVLSGKAVVSSEQITNVKFPKGFFEKEPNVVATASGPAEANVVIVYESVSKEGFGLRHNHTSDLYVYWIAIGN